MTDSGVPASPAAPALETAPAPAALATSDPGPGTWAAATVLGALTGALITVRTRPDVDLWLHLRVGGLLGRGEWFGVLPDPLTTLADRPYVPTQWLAQVGMARLYDVAGMTGVQLARVLLVAALGALVLIACRMLAGPPATAVAATLMMFSTSAGWGERPQLLGLVLLAVVVGLWWRALRRGRAPWVVVPLLWLWASSHGSWVVGLAVGALFALGGLLDGAWRGRHALSAFGVTVAGTAVACLTPLGLAGLTAPFSVGSSARRYVNEWQPPEPTYPLLLVLLAGALLAVLGVLRSRELRWTRLLTVIAALVLSLSMVRTIAVGAVLVAPAVAVGIAVLRGPVPSRSPLMRSERAVWALALVLVLAVGGWHAASTPWSPPISPALSEAVGALPPGTTFAVDGRAVAWVEFAHPEQKPMKDLRAEVYSDRVATAYRVFQEAEPGWREYVTSHRIGAVLTHRTEPLDRAVEADGGWAVTAQDSEFRLWVRR